MNREQHLADVFVTLADTLVDDFDAVELLNFLAKSAVDLLGVDDAGIMLADDDGTLKLVALSSDTVRALELYEIQANEGPCLDCYRNGKAEVNVDLSVAADRWPNYTRAATETGVRSTHSLPLRLRGVTIGAMNLFSEKSETLAQSDVALGQALTDMATIAILNDRAISESAVLAQQLQTALSSRIRIEQAKGVVAAWMSCTPAEAFQLLRAYSQRNHTRITTVAELIINGDLDLRE